MDQVAVGEAGRSVWLEWGGRRGEGEIGSEVREEVGPCGTTLASLSTMRIGPAEQKNPWPDFIY